MGGKSEISRVTVKHWEETQNMHLIELLFNFDMAQCN